MYPQAFLFVGRAGTGLRPSYIQAVLLSDLTLDTQSDQLALASFELEILLLGLRLQVCTLKLGQKLYSYKSSIIFDKTKCTIYVAYMQ